MDLILRDATLADRIGATVDIGIAGGRIVAIEPGLTAEGEVVACGGRLVSPGLIEPHIHLDKSNIVDRCKSDRGDLEEAIQEVAKAKKAFTPEDVYTRGQRTLERSILNGVTHMRTHVELDPGIGHRGLEGVRQLVEDYKALIDIQICVFPQEGLLNNPGTDDLMVEALRGGVGVVGAAPYVDTDPRGQIERVFAMAREFDADVDMHLDFGPDPTELDLVQVCELTTTYKYGGRVAIGHVTKLSAASPALFDASAKRMADAGVALIVMPATDLYLMGRHMPHSHMRGLVAAHKMIHRGVNAVVCTNNVLNPFTPFGDCAPIRMANMYANICQVGAKADMRACFDMITTRPAQLMRLDRYGLTVGKPADLAVLDAGSPEQAVAELSPVLHAFKNGRRTVTRSPAMLSRSAA